MKMKLLVALTASIALIGCGGSDSDLASRHGASAEDPRPLILDGVRTCETAAPLLGLEGPFYERYIGPPDDTIKSGTFAMANDESVTLNFADEMLKRFRWTASTPISFVLVWANVPPGNTAAYVYAPPVATSGEEYLHAPDPAADVYFVKFCWQYPPPPQGCTLTQGYWKTHSMKGPAPYDDTWAEIGEDTPFFLSGKSYYQVMWTPPKGNPYYILAPQYVAAKLNGLAGASMDDVQDAFDKATALFETTTPAQALAKKEKFVELAGKLAAFNEGYTGPGHCDDEEYVPE